MPIHFSFLRGILTILTVTQDESCFLSNIVITGDFIIL